MNSARHHVPEVPPRWWSGHVTVGNFVHVMVIAFACAGFYFTTAAGLADHAREIVRIDKAMSEISLENKRVDNEGRIERDKSRAEIGARAERTADGIAELNKRMAVAETKYDGIKEELVKIGHQLEIFMAAISKR